MILGYFKHFASMSQSCEKIVMWMGVRGAAKSSLAIECSLISRYREKKVLLLKILDMLRKRIT